MAALAACPNFGQGGVEALSLHAAEALQLVHVIRCHTDHPFSFHTRSQPSSSLINGGQEFLRTKRGNHNSYNADDTVNAIDFSFKDTYSDVYNTYKGLIAFRKANSEFFGNNEAVTAAKAKNGTKSVSGVTKYEVGSNKEFCIYFNATKTDFAITTDGYTKAIDVTSGEPEEVELPTSVPAKGFVILAK